ncbi:tripartite motif containing 13-like isoform X3 [Acanthaster planci]|uniref:Tripartite motif containing 13-like isoform X3 n=1 Tax=Acanthaster planci TaxID=133434 RepID=A0A8B7ZB63_ACAPL|nr:tripartite motif containing 13-like isoform X3 [Acanthaster planci]
MAEGGIYRSNLRKFSEEHLQCSICQDLFKNPKTLNCLHSFCEDCLFRCHSSRVIVRNVICPICREETRTPSGTVNSLRSDFKLAGMIEAVGKEDVQAEPTCVKHAGKKCYIFCCTCHELICFSCLRESHCSHNAGEVGETVEELKQSVIERTIQFDKSSEAVATAQETIEKRKQDFNTTLVKIRKDITDRVKEEIARITVAKQCIMDELDHIQKDRTKLFARRSKHLSSIMEDLHQISNDSKLLAKIGNDYDFLKKYQELKAGIFADENYCCTQIIESISPLALEFRPSVKNPWKFNLGVLVGGTTLGGEDDDGDDHGSEDEQAGCEDDQYGEDDSDTDVGNHGDSLGDGEEEDDNADLDDGDFEDADGDEGGEDGENGDYGGGGDYVDIDDGEDDETHEENYSQDMYKNIKKKPKS